MTPAHPDLLDAVAAAVDLDPFPTGLRGKLCLALARPDGPRRWVLDLGPRRGGFVDEIPDDCDVTVLIRESAASRVLSPETAAEAPPDANDGLEVVGDARLFAAFVRRYFMEASLLALRLGARGVR